MQQKVVPQACLDMYTNKRYVNFNELTAIYIKNA